MGQQPSFACVNCGDDVPVVHPGRARAVVCGACGAQHDLFAAGAPIIDMVPLQMHRPEGLLQLGSKGRLGQRVVQVVGRLRLSTMVQGRVRLWEEWLLITHDGSYLRIHEADGHYTMLIPFQPSRPLGPDFFEHARQHGVRTLPFDGEQATVAAGFSAKVQFVEGELTARICMGDLLDYAELETRQGRVACQLTLDDQWCFLAEPLEDRAMWDIFGYDGILAAHDALHHARERNGVLAASISQAAAVLLVISVLGGVIIGGVVASHQDVTEGWARFDFSSRDQVIEESTGVAALHRGWGFYSVDVACGLDQTSEGIELLAEAPSGRKHLLVRCRHENEGRADRMATHSFRVDEEGAWRILAIHRAETGGDGRASLSWQIGWDLGSIWFPLYGVLILLGLGLLCLILSPLARIIGIASLEREFEMRRAELALFLRKRFSQDEEEEAAPPRPLGPGELG